MYPGNFTYHSPETIEEAIDLLERHGSEAKLLAGGHSLIPMMKLRLVDSAHLIDLKKLRSSLNYIKEEGGRVAIGALATHHQLEASELLQAQAPLLSEAASVIGDVQVRNMGTFGGSLAHADPAADHPAPALALEAEIVAQGSGGRRTVAAEDFFLGLFATALEPPEVLVEIGFPALPTGTGSCYLKYPHPASGYAVCGVAALITRDGDGNCSRCRVGITGISDGPYRARGVEEQLEGQAVSSELLAEAAEKATDGIEPLEDFFADADYRSSLAATYVRRALATAWERAG